MLSSPGLGETGVVKIAQQMHSAWQQIESIKENIEPGANQNRTPRLPTPSSDDESCDERSEHRQEIERRQWKERGGVIGMI